MKAKLTSLQFAGVILVLAAVYVVAAKLGLMLAFVHASATAVWPPTGITLAALLILGYRVWPGIFLGAFLANLLTAGSMMTSLGIATGNTLEGLDRSVGWDGASPAWVLCRLAAYERPRNRFRVVC